MDSKRISGISACVTVYFKTKGSSQTKFQQIKQNHQQMTFQNLNKTHINTTMLMKEMMKDVTKFKRASFQIMTMKT